MLSRVVATGRGRVSIRERGADAAWLPGRRWVRDPATLGPVVQVWTALFGVSFEVFGQLHNVVERREEFFHDAFERLGDLLGLPPR